MQMSMLWKEAREGSTGQLDMGKAGSGSCCVKRGGGERGMYKCMERGFACLQNDVSKSGESGESVLAC